MITASPLGRLRSRLDRSARRRARIGMPPPQVLIETPNERFEYGDINRRFHCASIDKVLTATAIGRLVDRGQLRFEAPLGYVLPASDFNGLPAAEGVDIGAEVTIDHLLTHASGLPDFFDPPRGQRTVASMQGAVRQPDRTWTRGEILAEVRTLRATGRPGQRFAYSDTGYLLLGRVLEEAAGATYADVLAGEIFEQAGMARTAMPFDDAFTPERLAELDPAPIWLGRAELSRRASLSLGWGSVLTTVDDLVRFQRALHGGELVRPETLQHLTRPRHRLRPAIHYGAGAVTLRFGELMPLLLRGLPEPVGGLGISATHLFYYPAQRAHVVLNFHATGQMRASFELHVQIARMLARVAGQPESVTENSALTRPIAAKSAGIPE